MKKLLFIGHEFHKTTKSSYFMQELLAEKYEIESFYIDPYKITDTDFAQISGKTFDILVLWQVMPSLMELEKYIKFKTCAFFPMYDHTKTLNSPLWNEYKNCNIINFSKAFHKTCKEGGLSSYYIQYFPKPADILDEGDEKSIFFWQRSDKITTKTLEKVIDIKKIDKLYLHKNTDPKNKFIPPSKNLESKVVYSSWFDTKDEMQKYIQKSALYFAPRRYEGIGMSFLEAMAAGEALPNMLTNTWWFTFAQLGGSGGIIGLAICMFFFAKSERYKTLGKIAILPALCSISEPLVFGVPLVLNVMMLIPMILSPLLCFLSSYIVTIIGLVPYLNGIQLSTGTPVVLAGFLAGGWQAAVWQIVLVALQFAVYFPFFRIVDKQALEAEQAEAAGK